MIANDQREKTEVPAESESTGDLLSDGSDGHDAANGHAGESASDKSQGAGGEELADEQVEPGEQNVGDEGLTEEEAVPTAKPVEGGSGDDGSEADDDEAKKEWYILKVQSNREKSICEGLQRRVAVEGLGDYFGEILVPTEDVAEFKNGKRKVVKRKLYPGYIVVHMVINDDTWFLVRETPGIGDFTGSAGKPTPMLPHEVERIIKSAKPDDEGSEPVKTAIPFKVGDRARIKDGTFENFEGDVEGIDEANGRVTVMINIFGRSTPVELEHWQIENV